MYKNTYALQTLLTNQTLNVTNGLCIQSFSPVNLSARSIGYCTDGGHLKLVVESGSSRVCCAKAYDLQDCPVVVDLRKVTSKTDSYAVRAFNVHLGLFKLKSWFLKLWRENTLPTCIRPNT